MSKKTRRKKLGSLVSFKPRDDSEFRSDTRTRRRSVFVLWEVSASGFRGGVCSLKTSSHRVNRSVPTTNLKCIQHFRAMKTVFSVLVLASCLAVVFAGDLRFAPLPLLSLFRNRTTKNDFSYHNPTLNPLNHLVIPHSPRPTFAFSQSDVRLFGSLLT